MSSTDGEPRLLLAAETMGGGLGNVVRDQATWFRRAGWSVAVAAPDDEGGPPSTRYYTVSIPMSARNVRAMALTARQLRRVIRAETPDVIHCHGLRAFVVTWLALSQRPYVTLHGTGSVPSDPIGYGIVRRLGIRLSPFVAAGAFNAGLEQHPGWTFMAHASPRLITLEQLPFPAADTVPTFLWLGRLSEQKRPDLFVRSIAAAAQLRPVRGVLAGEGPRSMEIRRLIADLDAPIEVVGHTDNVVDLLRRCWALVLFSRFEGLAFAAEEAMWAGRVVISSPLPGISWLLGKDAFVASDVADAAKAIVTLADHDVAATAGHEAARRVRRLLVPGAPWPATETIFRNRINGSG